MSHSKRRLRAVWAAVVVAGLSWWAPILYAWTTPTLGIAVIACTNSGTTCTLALTSLTTGSGLLLAIGQGGAATNTGYTATDGIPNTYTEWSTGIVRSTGGSGDRACTFLLAHNITTTAGALTVVVTRSGDSAAFVTYALEIKDMTTSSATDVQGSVAESSSLQTHPMAGTGLNTLTDIFMVGVAAGNGVNASYLPATDFTSITGTSSTSTNVTGQHLSSAAARSAETATWTNTGTGRVMANCLIALKSATSGAGSGPPNGSLSMMGFGK